MQELDFKNLIKLGSMNDPRVRFETTDKCTDKWPVLLRPTGNFRLVESISFYSVDSVHYTTTSPIRKEDIEWEFEVRDLNSTNTGVIKKFIKECLIIAYYIGETKCL